MTDFIILFEHRNRELEAVCLLKEELRRRGYRVRVANARNWRTFSTFRFYRPRVVVTPWLYNDDDIACVNRFSIPVRKIVNLQCEQITQKGVREKGAGYPTGLARQAFHVCWGKQEREYLIKAGLQEEKLLLTGSISMDLNRPMFRTLFLSRHELAQKYHLDETCSWKLFISSFAATDLSGKLLDYMESINPNIGMFMDISKQTRKILLEWFERYAVGHPKTIFIYRPHPNEIEDPEVLALSNRIDNFRVISEKSVRQWILCCDTINNWISTSISDACMIGKKSSILRPVFIPQEMDNEELCLEKFITTYEDFEAFNEGDSKEVSGTLVKTINQFYQIDVIPAYAKVADYLEKILHSDYEVDYSQAICSFQLMPLWKYMRRDFFIRMIEYMPLLRRFIRDDERMKVLKRTEKECKGITRDYYKTSKKMRKIIKNSTMEGRDAE